MDSLHGRLLKVGRERDRRAVAPCPLHCLGGNEIEPHLFRFLRLLFATRKIDQLGDQRRHLGQLLDDVGEQTFPFAWRKRAFAGEHLDVRAQARQRRAQLVRRICDQLALGARGLLKGAEHRVEAAGEPAELVPPADVDALGQVSRLGDLLRRPGESTNRSKRRSRHSQPECRRDRDSATGDENKDVLDAAE